MFITLWDVKEPTKYLQIVGHEVLGFVPVPCECNNGWVDLTAGG